MSNSFTSPPLLTDPGMVVSGKPIRAQEINRLRDSVNYGFAHACTSNAISQSFQDQSLITDQTSLQTMCEWAIPTASDQHRYLDVYLFGVVNAATLGGEIKITVEINSVSHSQSLTSSLSGTFRDSLTVDFSSPIGAEIAYVTLEMKAATGTQIYINDIMMRWRPLSSPLAAGQLSRQSSKFIPGGSNRTTAQQALSSRYGVDLLNNLDHLRRRPRILITWSGVQNASPAPTGSHPYTGSPPPASGEQYLGAGLANFEGGSLRTNAPIFEGTREDGNLKFFVIFKVSSGTVRFSCLNNDVTATGAGWHTQELNITEESVTWFNILQEIGLDGWNEVSTLPVFSFGMSPLGSSAANQVISLSIFGA